MGFDGAFGCAQQMGNLLVQFATDHESENFALARRQRRDQRFEGIELVLALLLRRMARQRALDCFQQRFAGYGFGEEVFGAGLYRAHAGGNISMTRHEDNPTDRKSTRLNSSHYNISYAV